jgi:hypothetical protein
MAQAGQKSAARARPHRGQAEFRRVLQRARVTQLLWDVPKNMVQPNGGTG